MIQVNSNGTKRRINGAKLKKTKHRNDGLPSNVTASDYERDVRAGVQDKLDELTKRAEERVRKEEKSNSSYSGEKIVGYMGLMLLLGAGWQLATVSADSALMMWGQRIGFIASTVFIMVLKHKLSKGQYIGPQRRFAEKLFYSGVGFESFTLLAKYFSDLVPAYLFLVGFTIPALIIAAFQVMTKDPKRRLRILEEENRIMKKQLEEERDLLRVKGEMMKEITDLRAEEKIEDSRNDERIRLATKSKRRISRVAKKENEIIIVQMETDAGIKRGRGANKQLNVSDAKIIGNGHSRKKKGPSNKPQNPNKPKCKNPDCINNLTGNQTVACSNACRQRVNRLIKAGKLKKTW